MSNIYKLSIKERKLLKELDRNCRQPSSVIAKKIGVSRQVADYTIKRFEKEKIILSYYPIIDVRKLGNDYIRIFIKLHIRNPKIENALIKYALEKKEINWVVVNYGTWDFTFIVSAKNTSEFENVYDDLINNFGKYFSDKLVSIAFRLYHFMHNYLYPEPDNTALVLGPKNFSIMKTDKIDEKILELLSKDARTPLIEMAKILNINSNTIKYRLDNLEKKGVILGYSIKLNIKKLGYEHYKVFLYLENLDEMTFNQLFEYLKSNKNVIFITKAMGIADLEFEIVVENQTELFEFMDKFKNDFKGIVNNYKTDLVFDEPLISYLSS